MALSLKRWKELRKWREYVPKMYEALRKRGLKGYVVGSVAEGTYDCSSDFDLAVVVNRKLDRKDRISLKMELEEEMGLPQTFPLEIHLVTEDELRRYERKVPLEELL